MAAFMDNYIRKVKITSLFNQKDLTVDFVEHINCIYGVNGSGKTTVINLIVACLSCDVRKLLSIDFSSVEIFTSQQNKTRAKNFLKVIRTKDNRIEYEIPAGKHIDTLGLEEYDIPTSSDNIFGEITSLINEHIKLNYVPLTRLQEADIYDLERSEDFYLSRSLRARHLGADDISYVLDPNKRMLVNIEDEFIRLFANAQKKINRDLEELKGKIVSKILINNEVVADTRMATYDFLNQEPEKFQHEDAERISEKFRLARIDVTENKIENHFKLYEGLLEELNNAKISISKDQKNDEKIQEYSAMFFQVLSLTPLYRRLSEIVDVIDETEKQKQTHLSIFLQFSKLINDFLINKEFKFSSSGKFDISCGDRQINIENLSSGEKHLITLMGRVCISGGESTVFVADEPELSLHLEWQRKIIPSIMSLSPNTQIIVATHSPAIIPDNANMIDLLECN